MTVDWNPSEKDFPAVKSHADQRNIYAENLAPDVAIWQGRNLTTTKLMAWVNQVPKTPVWRLMVIRDNVPSFVQHPRGEEFKCEGYGCNQRLVSVLEALQNWTKLVTFPDVLWYMNVDDVQVCR